MSTPFYDLCISVGSGPPVLISHHSPVFQYVNNSALFLVLKYANLVLIFWSIFSLEHLVSNPSYNFQVSFKCHPIKEVFPGHAFQGSYLLLLFIYFTIYPMFITIWDWDFFFYLNFIIFFLHYTQDCKLHKKCLFTRISPMPEQSGTEQALNTHALYKISDYNYKFNSIII